MNMEDYAKFVVMVEDAVATKNTSQMKWLGLESRRQAIQHEIIFLENAIQRSNKDPAHKEMSNEYERSIRSNLKHMKDVIVELRLNQSLNQQMLTIQEMTHSNTIFHAFMEEEVYAHFSAGLPMDQLSFDVKKSLHSKLLIVLDETI